MNFLFFKIFLLFEIFFMCFHVLIYIFCKFLCGFDHSQGKGLYPKGFGDCYQVEGHDLIERLGQS